MKKIKLYDLIEEVIFKVSSRVNKKALREVIQCELANSRHVDYNDILRKYYERVHRMGSDVQFLQYLHVEDEEDMQDVRDEGGKAYKTPYDYLNGGKIKQKNTGLVMLYTNGWWRRAQWAFDVEKYMQVMGYELTA